MEYRVIWSIDVMADDPETAVGKAKGLMKRADGHYFDVMEVEDREATEVFDSMLDEIMIPVRT